MSACKDDETVLSDITSYQRLIGKLIYLSHPRPDISYIVQFLSQFMHKPTHSHLQVALRLLRYLKKAPGKGILLEKGFCIFLGKSLVSWKSKKQATVSQSTAEAGYRAMCSATCEIIWLVNILKELKIPGLFWNYEEYEGQRRKAILWSKLVHIFYL
ncbi:putative RNA-directed DNA polymerase [Helianthus annuus]|nr:putative RNA-directed DNA polymerase [Helianthus annuus]